MFLGVLTDDEKQAFAALAQRMIQSDGIVVGAERAALAALQREMGVDESSGPDASDLAQLASAFTSRRSRVAALLELVGLGYSDSSYSVDEHSMVSDVAQAMGLEPDDLVKIEQWVARHVNHVEAALAMMQEPGQAQGQEQ